MTKESEGTHWVSSIAVYFDSFGTYSPRSIKQNQR